MVCYLFSKFNLMCMSQLIHPYYSITLQSKANDIYHITGRFVLVHDTHKSQCNYILYTEGVNGDTTDKCKQPQLNAGLSVLLSW